MRFERGLSRKETLNWRDQEAIFGPQERLGRDKKTPRVSELAPRGPLLEWFIRWLGAKPDSQRNLLKRLASYAIDPGVGDRRNKIKGTRCLGLRLGKIFKHFYRRFPNLVVRVYFCSGVKRSACLYGVAYLTIYESQR